MSTGGGTRGLNVYYSVPEQGVNDKTGILLLIPGYGGHANSNVYKKMRRLFPDQYNLIVVQCDYFGWEFMQNQKESLLAYVSQLQMKFTPQSDEFSMLLPISLPESIHNFNDMGPVQVMDLQNSLKLVLEKYDVNRSKIIAYGHSHGAYLALLANILMPRLFSSIIDISAMLFPVHFGVGVYRTLPPVSITYANSSTGKKTKLALTICMEYLNSKISQDVSIYDLNRWYRLRDNLANIISFQGADDTMVPPDQKKEFLSKVDHATCVMVDASKVDNKIFSSTEHGCGADFLELFQHVWETYDLTADHECGALEDQSFETDSFRYDICRLADRMRMFVTPRSC